MQDALSRLCRGGVVGGGGAGFPTWKKLEAKTKTLLINGAECEPLLKSDQFYMLHRAGELVAAARVLGALTEAEDVCIALKAHYHPQVDALRQALKSSDAAIRLCELPSVYPIGDEQAIVHACTGLTVAPQALPGSVGCTVVSVSTALTALAALDGTPVTTRLITVTGEVRQPGLYEVPIGTLLSDVLSAAGGARIGDYAVLLGGPMMGACVRMGDDCPLTRTASGVIVLPPDHLLVRRAELPLVHMRNRAKAACIQCRFCTDLCPRFLSGHPMYPHRAMRAFAADQTDATALLCMECGVCELSACPMGLSPRRIMAAMKPALRQSGTKPDTDLHPEQSAMRASRQLASSRLVHQINVAAYDMPVPAEAIPVAVTRVSIPLKQHIGAPTEPTVSVGDHVRVGQTIGRTPEGALGADVHASIDGIVTRVGDCIDIQTEQSGGHP